MAYDSQTSSRALVPKTYYARQSEARITKYPLDPQNSLVPPSFVSVIPGKAQKDYYSLSVNDIHRFRKEKMKANIKIYEKVLGKCFRRIRDHVLHNQSYCVYNIPEYLPGFPLYNLAQCSYFILQKLKQGGYTTRFIPPVSIVISWPYQKRPKTLKTKTVAPKEKVIPIAKKVLPNPKRSNASSWYATQKEERFFC